MIVDSYLLAREDKRKSWTITIVVHALLLLLCLLPFIVDTPENEDFLQAITINFDQPSTRQSGSAAATGGASSEASPPREQVAVASVPAMTPATSLAAPSRQIQTTEVNPEVFVPTTKSPSSQSDNYFNQPLNVDERVEVDRVEAFKEKPNPKLQQQVTWHIAEAESADSGAPTNFEFKNGQGSGTGQSTTGQGSNGNAPNGDVEDAGYNPFGDGSFPSGTGTGTGNKGKDSGFGNEGRGLQWGDFAGDGLFNRKVIKRANVARIAVQEGKVVVNLCVDQLGKVVFAQYDTPNSTISDKALLAKAQDCAKQYVFDEDPSAPREQCGRLTFIFKIEK